jgi:hypothetical protein
MIWLSSRYPGTTFDRLSRRQPEELNSTIEIWLSAQQGAAP